MVCYGSLVLLGAAGPTIDYAARFEEGGWFFALLGVAPEVACDGGVAVQ